MTFKSWIFTSEKKGQVARIGVRGGRGFRWFRQCPKENFFFIDVFPKTDEFSEKGVGLVFNPKNYTADFGILDRPFWAWNLETKIQYDFPKWMGGEFRKRSYFKIRQSNIFDSQAMKRRSLVIAGGVTSLLRALKKKHLVLFYNFQFQLGIIQNHMRSIERLRLRLCVRVSMIFSNIWHCIWVNRTVQGRKSFCFANSNGQFWKSTNTSIFMVMI